MDISVDVVCVSLYDGALFEMVMWGFVFGLFLDGKLVSEKCLKKC